MMNKTTMASGVAAVALLTGGVVLFTDGAQAVSGPAYTIARPSDTELASVAGAHVLFAHQSVGQNVLDGVRAVYAGRPTPLPPMARDAPGIEQAGITDLLIGVNGDPRGKIAAFDARIRSGTHADVALLKLCYLDIVAGTEVEGVFTAYRDTLRALAADFPDIEFMAVTVPLSTERTLKRRVKAVLGRDPALGAEDNLARERFNALLRAEFTAGDLFDLAAIESTRPDGTRVAYREGGETFFALYPGYAADASHLNAHGSQVAAGGFLAAVAARVDDTR